MGNKTNHPKKYVRWSDWEAWLLKEWHPFRQKIMENDLPHMKTDIAWLKRLMIGLILVIVGSAIAIILSGG